MRLTGSQNSNPTLIGKTGIFFLMLSIAVLFGTLSVAFLITPERIDSPFHVPGIFYINTVFLLMSSVALHYAWLKRHQFQVTTFIRYALILGGVFLLFQVYGWYQLFGAGIPFTGKNPKMSYLYLLTGVHGIHLIGGILFLFYVFQGFQKKARKHFEIAVYFWHFLGLLWVYLLALLLAG